MLAGVTYVSTKGLSFLSGPMVWQNFLASLTISYGLMKSGGNKCVSPASNTKPSKQ